MANTQRTSPEMQQAILSQWNSGSTTREIANNHGIPIQRVQNILKRSGVRLRDRPMNRPSASKNNHLKIVEWAAAGLHITEIARRIGTSHHRLREYADRHNIQFVKKDQTGSGASNWQGGRMIDKDGYVLIYSPDHPNCNRHGYMREHRLVMEQVLGRLLDAKEVVHHLDGDKQNNSPENLQVFERNADHLAETLKGKVPKWTDDGKARILAGSRRPRGPRRKPNLLQ